MLCYVEMCKSTKDEENIIPGARFSRGMDTISSVCECRNPNQNTLPLNLSQSPTARLENVQRIWRAPRKSKCYVPVPSRRHRPSARRTYPDGDFRGTRKSPCISICPAALFVWTSLRRRSGERRKLAGANIFFMRGPTPISLQKLQVFLLYYSSVLYHQIL